ncbi:unnamed protein product [Paramecium octaurelia]|uniref:Uncharacterized protein n=1 Tax=Paramecium octaurelia TaxID=43137 RepID=A0A8S1U2R0_PAROT|nr:unnamed protein product [Paramecium octaurelia]
MGIDIQGSFYHFELYINSLKTKLLELYRSNFVPIQE